MADESRQATLPHFPNGRRRAGEAGPGPAAAGGAAAELERRGRRWIFGSFVLCPCHLPLSLAVLAAVLGGTALGALLRDHAVLAGALISLAWAGGTWRGFRLVRAAERGACPVPARSARPGAPAAPSRPAS